MDGGLNQSLVNTVTIFAGFFTGKKSGPKQMKNANFPLHHKHGSRN